MPLTKEASMADEFEFVEKEYLSVLELAFEVSQALSGKVMDGRRADIESLALKLYAHGCTAHWLFQGTKVPVPASTGGSSFVDFASMAVIGRAALETYVTFFEVFVQPTSDDEFEFNYCLWQLAGNVFLERMGPVDPQRRAEHDTAIQEITDLRNRIRATARFTSLTKGQQDEALEGKRHRDWEVVAKSAGFGFQFLRRRVYPYYSGFVHADGLTSGQLLSAQSREDKLFHGQLHLVTLIILLSKFILNYQDLFSEARAVMPRFTEAQAAAKRWSEAARNQP
jgi:hypothetical protein